MTAELGRQPWLVYGLFRTAQGASPKVHSGSTLFTLIGFTGLYFVLGLLFVFLVGREIVLGPLHGHGASTGTGHDDPPDDAEAAGGPKAEPEPAEDALHEGNAGGTAHG